MRSKVLNMTTDEIALSIVTAYDKGSGIFNSKTNAEDMVPDAAPEVQAQFLFWVIQMDYATKSSRLYKNALVMFRKNPLWIDTDYILNLNREELTNLVKQYLKPRYASEITKRFAENAKMLEATYDGKAYNMIRSAESGTALLRKVREFRGFGPKLGNFLIRTYVDKFQLEYEDIDHILPPVDVHDVRLTHEWGLIDDDKMTPGNVYKVKQIWSEACIEAKVSWITFDKALWLLGSKGQRTKNPIVDYIMNTGLDDEKTR